MKFSGSPRRSGENIIKANKNKKKTIKPKISLDVWYQWNGTFLGVLAKPRGLFEPVW